MYLKIKNPEGIFIEVTAIKSLHMIFSSKLGVMQRIQSCGWKESLNHSGSRFAIFKIAGTINEASNNLFIHYSLTNSLTDYEIGLDSGRKIMMQCAIETYETLYDPQKFDDFALTLVSSGEVSCNLLYFKSAV